MYSVSQKDGTMTMTMTHMTAMTVTMSMTTTYMQVPGDHKGRHEALAGQGGDTPQQQVIHWQDKLAEHVL